jgi:multidrug transporter EmrE-like cation transporter
VAQFLFFAAVYAAFGVGFQYALLYPLGVAVVLYIIAGAVWRGEQVQWKGRHYTTNMG